ncbi:hypothetical protein D9619_008583 [Psilocybe cf. subviscida]|uniref:Uncharacterized protein n=1 Tax=Psilocybe cf. subviscida TaxID=2480587 RepID=A0A8H5BAK5_9AGAR|nr:hypothetical protein D9619_008583 [Psilocybe cf. subviscida]
MINELRAASEDVGGGGASPHPHPHWFMSTMSLTPSIRTAIGQASRRSGASSSEVQSAYGVGRDGRGGGGCWLRCSTFRFCRSGDRRSYPQRVPVLVTILSLGNHLVALGASASW